MEQRIHSSRPLAVVCAMESELRHLRDVLGQGSEEWHAGRGYWLGFLERQPVVLVRCGIGMAGAAAVTEALVGRHDPIAVINYGCSNAHRPELLPGDLVIGSRVVAYDSIEVHPDGTERYSGMRYMHHGTGVKVAYLEADQRLLDTALSAAERLEGSHEPWPVASMAWPATVAHRTPRVFVGTVASANRWNRGEARIQALAAMHASLCEDMEAAAIAMTCASHDVPFLTIKDISNNELLRLTGDTFGAETEGQLGRRADVLVLATMRELVAAKGTVRAPSNDSLL